jgi:transcriptional regulator GlxA family with amidase domain
MDIRVRQALRLMSRDLSHPLNLKDVARAVSLSTPRLRYLCKAETGMTPARYLKAMRMQEARRLLETTFLSVKQVAAEIGIRDVSHFVRDFKKAYGLTPTQHREQQTLDKTHT